VTDASVGGMSQSLSQLPVGFGAIHFIGWHLNFDFITLLWDSGIGRMVRFECQL
jgi:hypothetical protein